MTEEINVIYKNEIEEKIIENLDIILFNYHYFYNFYNNKKKSKKRK